MTDLKKVKRCWPLAILVNIIAVPIALVFFIIIGIGVGLFGLCRTLTKKKRNGVKNMSRMHYKETNQTVSKT